MRVNRILPTQLRSYDTGQYRESDLWKASQEHSERDIDQTVQMAETLLTKDIDVFGKAKIAIGLATGGIKLVGRFKSTPILPVNCARICAINTANLSRYMLANPETEFFTCYAGYGNIFLIEPGTLSSAIKDFNRKIRNFSRDALSDFGCHLDFRALEFPCRDKGVYLHAHLIFHFEHRKTKEQINEFETWALGRFEDFGVDPAPVTGRTLSYVTKGNSRMLVDTEDAGDTDNDFDSLFLPWLYLETRLRTHLPNQKMTIAAMVIAAMKISAQRS